VILLIRHAHAIDREEGDIDDEARWLTVKGRRVAGRAGRALRELGLVPDEIWTSPLVRAVQTAELVAQGAGYSSAVGALEALAPGGRVHRSAEMLSSRNGIVAAVGHEPDISGLAAVLTRKTTFPAFKKGQVVVIENGEAVTTLDPDVFAGHK
jgi:phosphohistidine phosphatase